MEKDSERSRSGGWIRWRRKVGRPVHSEPQPPVDVFHLLICQGQVDMSAIFVTRASEPPSLSENFIQRFRARMTIPRTPGLIRVSALSIFGLTFLIVGVAAFYAWSGVILSLIKSQLVVLPDSRTFRIWRDTPVPQYMNFYFFNWTNSDRVGDEKPVLEELGPYSFSVEERKTNITFNANGTVTFRIKRFWYFVPENSYGSLDDEIITLNTVAKTAAHSIRNWNFFLRKSLSATMGAFSTEIEVRKTVGELLFDGYSDALLETASKLPAFSGLKVPFDKFGWFYSRNGSTDFDGTFNMDTGEKGVENVGVLRQWNFANSTGFYQGGCGLVNGSAGELFPPNVDIIQGIQMFSPDLCRSIKLNYDGKMEIHGLSGYKFSGTEYTFDNGTLDPANACFCDGECSPSGVLNVTSCRFGAPGFVSFPHFLLADPFYREQVDGMNPNAERHALYITLEQTLGIPLDVAARFQINILLSPDDVISLFKEMPTIYFPMIWFEQRASITSEMANELRAALYVSSWSKYAGTLFLTIGAGLSACALYIIFNSHNKVTNLTKVGNEEMKFRSLQNLYQPDKEVTEKETLLVTDRRVPVIVGEIDPVS